MRGDDRQQGSMFSYRSLEERVPKDHQLRPLREMVDAALDEMAPVFEGLYAQSGRPSIPPERLLRALLLQILFTVRSERQLMEELEYSLLSTLLGEFQRVRGHRMISCSRRLGARAR